jgi:putative ATP-binding cassette transporter
VLLFIISPLETILNMMPVMGRARVSSDQLDSMGRMLPEPEAGRTAIAAPERAWREIELRDVVHEFHSEQDEHGFTLGPINLRFEPGEIVFIVGGNGSGKTTLAKLLVGLYTPESGALLLDGVPVTEHNVEQYRQLFSTVFSDFYLFESLLGLEHADLDARAQEYLAMLRLEEKVKVLDGAFSTTKLSQGQRKRLALLTAYLEDRPVYLFDEWSADQEPLFREVFYHHILPALRKKSKTVIVITHDDRYFDLADRLIQLEYGRVRSERNLRKASLV